MGIEHIALYVRDLEGARRFFETYFCARSGSGYHNPRTDFRSYFLEFDDGSRLEIMTRPALSEPAAPGNSYGYAHIAFRLGSRDAVERLTQRLREDGYPTLSSPRVTGDGYFESCVQGFEGNILELTV